MKRLLCLVSAMDTGGAETFLMKIYRNIDINQYQMDFLCASLKEGFYEKEIKELGGKIFHIEPKNKGIIKNFKSIYKIIKDNKYDYVLKTAQKSLAGLDLLAAKLAKAKIRVFRSSNAGVVDNSFKERLIQNIFSFLPRRMANIRIAPSKEAAEYVFGKGCIENGKAIILKNGLDLNIYKYDESCRNKIRKEFNIEDKYIIGHIGRFNKQKNHHFLIKIFKEIHNIKSDAILMLVGDGELKEEIKNEIKLNNLDDYVIFMGIRKDIPDILSAMDMMIFPSYFEGMPNTIIEAQACGLPCLISDSITKEAKVTDIVKMISLNKDALYWAKEVFSNNSFDRNKTNELLNKAGYSIYDVSAEFVKMIFDNDKK